MLHLAFFTSAIYALPNPSAATCSEAGGKYINVIFSHSQTAGEHGICQFPDDSECFAWDHLRGKCKPGECLRMTIDQDGERKCITPYKSREEREGEECIALNTPRDIKWKFCAHEDHVCHCDGLVRYGKHERWADDRILQVDGQVDCSNSVFGDPYPGKRKECMCGHVPSDDTTAAMTGRQIVRGTVWIFTNETGCRKNSADDSVIPDNVSMFFSEESCRATCDQDEDDDDDDDDDDDEDDEDDEEDEKDEDDEKKESPDEDHKGGDGRDTPDDKGPSPSKWRAGKKFFNFLMKGTGLLLITMSFLYRQNGKVIF